MLGFPILCSFQKTPSTFFLHSLTLVHSRIALPPISTYPPFCPLFSVLLHLFPLPTPTPPRFLPSLPHTFCPHSFRHKTVRTGALHDVCLLVGLMQWYSSASFGPPMWSVRWPTQHEPPICMMTSFAALCCPGRDQGKAADVTAAPEFSPFLHQRGTSPQSQNQPIR